MRELNQWDIVEADVPYQEDHSKSSKRPVLILSETEYLVLKLTTHQHSDRPKPYEYEIAKWQQAGLSAQTYIQCDRVIRLPRERFTGRFFGRLPLADIVGVKAMMKYHGLIK